MLLEVGRGGGDEVTASASAGQQRGLAAELHADAHEQRGGERLDERIADGDRGVPQWRQRPRSSSHETTGMLS